jgi:hypothetical protein
VKQYEGTDFWITWVKDELQAGRHVKLTAEGWSMFPTLYRGVHLEISKVPISELSIGNLVAHERKGKAVLHRLIAIAQKDGTWNFQTQGDSSTQPDPLFDQSSYLGKVLSVNGNTAHKALQPNFKVNHRRNELLKETLLFLATPYRVARRLLKAL